MKRLCRLLLPFLLMTSASQAANVDCSDIQLYNLDAVIYKEKAVFPNPSKKTAVELAGLRSPFKACGVTFTSKNQGEIISIESDKLSNLAILTNHFRQPTGMNLPLYLIGNGGETADGLDITLTLVNLYTTYNATISVNIAMYKNTVVGVKVDGGKIQPLFYDGKTLNIPISKRAKALDFYVKTSLPTSWQRVSVNLITPKITIYRKAAFPRT